eukprot:3782243-Amphidinium_carterae.2
MMRGRIFQVEAMSQSVARGGFCGDIAVILAACAARLSIEGLRLRPHAWERADMAGCPTKTPELRLT